MYHSPNSTNLTSNHGKYELSYCKYCQMVDDTPKIEEHTTARDSTLRSAFHRAAAEV